MHDKLTNRLNGDDCMKSNLYCPFRTTMLMNCRRLKQTPRFTDRGNVKRVIISEARILRQEV
jgi:hypothetical protein